MARRIKGKPVARAERLSEWAAPENQSKLVSRGELISYVRVALKLHEAQRLPWWRRVLIDIRALWRKPPPASPTVEEGGDLSKRPPYMEQV